MSDPLRNDWHRPSRVRRASTALAVVGMVVAAAPVFAAPPSVGTAFQSVEVDNVLLGDDFTPTLFNSYDPTILFDPATSTFHMWVHGDTGTGLASIVHATSTDGVDFTSTGNLSYAGGSPFPSTEFDAATEPVFQFIRAVRSGANWKLLIWSPNGQPGDYNYNLTLFNLGTDPNNLSATHQGPIQPVPGGTSGLVNGAFGLVSDTSLFTEYDPVGGLARWTLTDASPPSVGAASGTKDLITGTGSVNFTIDPTNAAAAYVNNAGRTLDQGDGTLGTFYALRTFGNEANGFNDGSRVSKQIFYVESANGGTTWTDPVGLFADGNAVTVDGGANTANFSHPELVLVNGARVLYFTTANADEKFLVVTNVASVPTSTPTTTATATVTGTATVTPTGTITPTRTITPTATNTPEFSPPAAPEIPTLSGAGTGILVMLLLAMGVLYLARTRR